METLKQKTARGLLWGGLNSGIQQVLGLAFGIILGRLLCPDDYGMMAMISIFSLVASALQDSGFRTALINLRHPTAEDYNSVFWFNMLMAVALYLILFFAAPLIGQYYHTERIVPLCRYAFLTIILSALGAAQSAYLVKNLKAKQQATAAAVGVLVSNTVGVTMAYAGFAYWALATQNLIYIGVYVGMQWYYSPWRPTLHGITFAPVRKMFRFSCKVLATSIVNHVNNNVLNILLGHYFSPHDTGNFNQAYQWNMKGYSLVQSMILQVAQPVLVGLDDDRERQLRVFRKMVRFTSFISFPLLFGFALVSQEFIVLALTEKWLASASLLQLLCISGAVMPLCALFNNMVVSKGRSDILLWCTFSLGLLQMLLMIALWPWGIRVMVEAFVVLNVSWLLVWCYFVRRLTGYSFLMLARDILPFAAAAAAVMVFTHFVTLPIHNLWALLFARIAIAVAAYYAVMRVARVAILDECIAFVRGKMK
jgi:O-antigen/teichoic acid export membrane protein